MIKQANKFSHIVRLELWSVIVGGREGSPRREFTIDNLSIEQLSGAGIPAELDTRFKGTSHFVGKGEDDVGSEKTSRRGERAERQVVYVGLNHPPSTPYIFCGSSSSVVRGSPLTLRP